MSCETCTRLLSEGLDLCVRARKMDAIDRRNTTLAASCTPEAWRADGTFDRHVARHNVCNPDQPIWPKSATLHVWVQDQYDKDLADWERRARHHLMQGCSEVASSSPLSTDTEERERYDDAGC